MIYFGATDLENIEGDFDGWNPMGNYELQFWNNTVFAIFRYISSGLYY